MGLVLEIIAVSLVVLLALLASLFGRREIFIRRHGTVELYFRVNSLVEGRGWAPGFAQFRGDELRWYRMFSLSPHPRRILTRRELVVESRRAPTRDEALLVPAEWIVLHCLSGREPIQIAMPRQTLTGFLGWLESVTPYST